MIDKDTVDLQNDWKEAQNISMEAYVKMKKKQNDKRIWGTEIWGWSFFIITVLALWILKLLGKN